MPTYLTTAELAKSLHLTAETIRQLARDKKIPSIRISHKVIRFDAEDVATALKSLNREAANAR